MSEKTTVSRIALSDLDEQEIAILRGIHEPRLAALEGREIGIFAALTAQSRPGEIRRAAGRALERSEQEYRKLHPEQDYPESQEFIEFISLVFTIMAQEYVRGLRERESLRNVVDLEGLQAELAEIDENLIRHNLNHIEEADQLLRRKEIYETLHPETKAGTAGGIASGAVRGTAATVAVVRGKSFVADTAEKTGMAERTIRGKIQIAKGLTPEAREAIRDADISERNAAKLARIKDKDEQRPHAGAYGKEG